MNEIQDDYKQILQSWPDVYHCGARALALMLLAERLGITQADRILNEVEFNAHPNTTNSDRLAERERCSVREGGPERV